MTYYYDQYGWLTATILPERATDVPPPPTIPVGQAANWTGHHWIVLPYTPPPDPLESERQAMSCTPYAGELVLAQHGLRQGWLALLTNLPEADQVRFARAPRWRRTDPLMDGAIATLRPDLTDPADRAALLDTLFRAAMAIDAAAP